MGRVKVDGHYLQILDRILSITENFIFLQVISDDRKRVIYELYRYIF